MQVDLLSSAQSAHALHLFHQHSPLVHCMTNDVVQTFTANTLLALGASPAMVIETEEASQFAAIASALLINVGTLTQPRAQAMRAAVEQAKSSQTPWTLDPVAVGALDYRRHFCHELLSFKPAAIRGNASEIMALAGIANVYPTFTFADYPERWASDAPEQLKKNVIEYRKSLYIWLNSQLTAEPYAFGEQLTLVVCMLAAWEWGQLSGFTTRSQRVWLAVVGGKMKSIMIHK